MTFLSVLMTTVTATRVEWTPAAIPCPLTDPEGCNLDKPGWICDPDFEYPREQVNAISEILGPAYRVPIMSMLLLKPDDGADNFGTLQYESCELKKRWISTMKNVTYPFPEMQLGLIKGEHYRVCPAGPENLSTTARILHHNFEDLTRNLKHYLPALSKIVLEVRADMKVLRQWYHIEGTLFSMLAVAVGLVVIIFRQTRRYSSKGSRVALPWSV